MRPKKPLFLKLTSHLGEQFKEILKKDEYFIFWTSLLFYLCLYFNPNNKTLVLFFAFFTLLIFARFKKIEETLFWSFIASFPFAVGKSYHFFLIPASKLYIPNNPKGYFEQFILTITSIIAIFMFFLLFKKLRVLKKKETFHLDFSLICLSILIILVFFSTLSSKNPSLSFLFFLQFLQNPLAFLYAKCFIKWQQKNRNILLFLLLSQTIFESFWVFLQFANNGPLGKSIEPSRGIVPFGRGADEDIPLYRPTGTFDHANFVAAFLLSRVILTFAYFYNKNSKRNLSYLLTAFIFALPALIITLSRSAWLSLFLGTCTLTYILEKRYKLSLLMVYKKRLLSILLFVLLLFPIFIAPRIANTFYAFTSEGGYTARAKLTRESLELIKQNFFLGTGLKMSVPEMFKNNPRGIMYYFPTPVHNWYLRFASEVGVPALLVFVFLVNSSLRKIFVVKKGNIFLAGVFAASISVLVNAVLQPFFGGEELLYILLGILSL